MSKDKILEDIIHQGEIAHNLSKLKKEELIMGYQQEILLSEEKDRQIAELKEQLDKAIVPKFKEGQEIYWLFFETIFDAIYVGINEHYAIIECLGATKYVNVDMLFATREEAQQELEKLKGEQ